jgi:hypothetical protein
MGFMDKAKQAAQRAQQVLDEQQAKFNEAQSGRLQQGSSSPGTTYDEDGRPIPPASPSPGTGEPPPAGGPSAADPAPTAPDQASAPFGEGEAAAETPPEGAAAAR